MAKYERIDEETPNGGAYSEIFYLDDKHNVVDSGIAAQWVIRECKANGELICETWGEARGG